MAISGCFGEKKTRFLVVLLKRGDGCFCYLHGLFFIASKNEVTEGHLAILCLSYMTVLRFTYRELRGKDECHKYRTFFGVKEQYF